MKRFLVVQHSHAEFLGDLEKSFEDRAIGFVYQRPFTGQALSANALQFDALWLLGGAHPVTDRTACSWLDDELRLIAAFRRAQRPVVGIGFGALLLAQAAGGKAHAEPLHNAYWTIAHATASGRDDALARAVDGRKVLVLANGRVDLPPALAPIAVGDSGEWLAIRPDAFSYGLLFRPELKPGMIEDMIMETERPLPEHIGEILQQAREYRDENRYTTEAAVAALVSELDLMRERHKPPVINLSVVPKQ
ncbi:MAG: GMP synthase [Pseudomonadota bacterium]